MSDPTPQSPTSDAKPRTFAQNQASETILSRVTAIRAPRILRGIELSLIAFALIIGIAAIIIIDLTVLDRLSTDLLPAGIAYVVAVIAQIGRAHV